MVRPARHKKPVNYSQFEDSDSDDDFVPATAPLNKKSRTTQKELKLEKPEPKLKNLQEKDISLQEKTPKKRTFFPTSSLTADSEGTSSILSSAVPHAEMALDDKLYKRDLEVALALSVKEVPAVTIDVEQSQGFDKHGKKETGATSKSPHVSNCSVAGDYLDLDKITEEDESQDTPPRRKAASQAVVQQRKILLENGYDDGANDSEPDFATGEDSEDDSDFSGSEDDESFTVRKSKVKETKRKEVKAKPPAEKKEKPKPKPGARVTSVDCSPAAVKSESRSSPRKEASRTPSQIRSPAAESKRPKWVPPDLLLGIYSYKEFKRRKSNKCHVWKQQPQPPGRSGREVSESEPPPRPVPLSTG
ncbi:RAD51-associated protein 1 isoform X1 [Bos indicus x Bos taurus]|uniref:RAD51-associated protein 1 isoform X1 n=1 Tax=Bos indicus x Bos taurus TaxID=30522 RepID=UPI000F7D2893|nr:RAD51-associated protein 1 isoform X1 [Bos indicus x Bos taurus]